MRRKILKKKYKNLCRLLLGSVAFFGSMFIGQNDADALPVEPATINRENIQSIIDAGGGVMNITGTGNAFINWRDFSISPNEIVNFSGMNNMLNYVSGVNPSLIYGTINAPNVKDFYVINPSGVLFGPNSQVTTGNFYVSTRSLTENDIKKYVSNGTNPLDTSIDVSRINDGGLKSSDIIGAYDIADGDVMFLGKVQADSLKIEGNTIQIRNTKNITDADGNILTGDKVNLISNNPVEVGYEVDISDVSSTIDNPFNFDDSLSADDLLDALFKYYGLYKYDVDSATYKYLNGDTVLLDAENRQTYSSTNSASLENLRQFYNAKISASATENEKIIAAMALDQIIHQNIEQKKVKIYPDNVGIVEQFTYDNVSVLKFPSASDENYSTISDAFDTKLASLTSAYSTLTGSNTYKYYVADMLGDENMPDSANNLGYVAKNLDQSTDQTIEDYRLINSAYDLNLVNHSKFIDTLQLTSGGVQFLQPAEGKLHGKYMLGGDINLTDMNFKPLGYSMDYDDFTTEDDLLKFNGLNFTIKGLKTDTSASDAQGLFSVFAGSVKNLRLTDVNIDATSSDNSAVGGLIGGVVSGTDTTFKTTLKNISVNGSVKGNYFVGGLVGNARYGTSKYADETGYIIEGPYAYGGSYWDDEKGEYVDYDGYEYYYWDEEEDTYKSVILPEGYYVTTYEVYIAPGTPQMVFDNVENFAPVTSTDEYNSFAGGIAAKVDGVSTINNSMNQGKITAANYAGGIFGSLDGESYTNSAVIDKVANMGNVKSNEYAGGIIGVQNKETTISNSYNTASIEGANAGGISGRGAWLFTQVFNSGAIKGNYIGGLAAGYVNRINDSYNSGSVTSEDGRAFGIASNSILNNVYNSGDVTSGGTEAFGLVETLGSGSANIYNVGNISNLSNDGWAAGIAKSSTSGTVSNIYNLGKITNLSTSNNGDNYIDVSSGYAADHIYLKKGQTAGVINQLSSTASNIYNFGEVIAKNGTAGGIFNQLYGNKTYTNLFNFGNITGQSAAGIAANVSNSATLKNIYNLGKITATGTGELNDLILTKIGVNQYDALTLNYHSGDYAAGIVGTVTSRPTFNGVYNFGDIVSSKYAAGIVNSINSGASNSSYKVKFSNTYNFGNVDGDTGAAGILRISETYNQSRTFYNMNTEFNNVYNYGNITSSSGSAAGIYDLVNYATSLAKQGKTTFDTVYNFGNVDGATTSSGIINASPATITMTNVYNFGNAENR